MVKQRESNETSRVRWANARGCLNYLIMCIMLTTGGIMEAAELRLTSTPGVPGFSFLSWDTEGNVQTKLNLLRDGAGAVFQVETNGKWVDGNPQSASCRRP